ncbi:hypothetical protein [Anaeromyxobacter oryzae]|uniref:DUF4136 domain-containing protein n=1 Tax=Anaeromyxobacter oryzae TaxID=2918170 RepID=A0ABM7WSM8_9BACT|nr:hypothetical protein [Anaeromyxobacter oryzae]BDG02488.1 hypothetical protein AMOR_14840 [Anaeromyxobacter oryzae]
MWRISVALVAFVTFGCTTIRVPASSLGERLAPPAGAIAEPQVELWLESAKPVDEAEAEEARQLVRSALGTALAGREISPGALGAADPLLLVRARAVARTASHRSDQRAATVALVVGIVVVVAAVIAIVVLSKSAPKTHPPATARQGGTASAPAPRVSVPAPRPGVASGRVARPVPTPGFQPVPAPGVRPVPGRPFGSVPPPPAYGVAPWHGPNVWIGLDFVYVFPPPDYVVAPEPPYPGAPPAEAWAEPAPVPSDADAWTDEAEPEPMVELAVPPPPELAVEDRGFFTGDETVLEVDLFDHRTGALLWTRVARDHVDPRDAREMTKLLDRALANQPWIRRTAAAAR